MTLEQPQLRKGNKLKYQGIIITCSSFLKLNKTAGKVLLGRGNYRLWDWNIQASWTQLLQPEAFLLGILKIACIFPQETKWKHSACQETLGKVSWYLALDERAQTVVLTDCPADTNKGPIYF